MSDPFGNKLGGRGVCPYCNAAVNNVSYHREHQCEYRPEAVEDRYLEELDAKPKEIRSMTFPQFLRDIRESEEMKTFVKAFVGEDDKTLNEAVDELLGKEEKPTKQSLSDAFDAFFNEPTDQHQCKFDSDGGPCRMCGKTASETLFDVLSGKNERPKEDLLKTPKGLMIQCTSCKKFLTEPGALLFSPPYKTQDLAEKHHLCMSCYELACDVLNINFNFPREGND